MEKKKHDAFQFHRTEKKHSVYLELIEWNVSTFIGCFVSLFPYSRLVFVVTPSQLFRGKQFKRVGLYCGSRVPKSLSDIMTYYDFITQTWLSTLFSSVSFDFSSAWKEPNVLLLQSSGTGCHNGEPIKIYYGNAVTKSKARERCL